MRSHRSFVNIIIRFHRLLLAQYSSRTPECFTEALCYQSRTLIRNFPPSFGASYRTFKTFGNPYGSLHLLTHYFVGITSVPLAMLHRSIPVSLIFTFLILTTPNVAESISANAIELSVASSHTAICFAYRTNTDLATTTSNARLFPKPSPLRKTT